MEYAVSVWNPYLRKDVVAIEKVQERVLRIPHKLREMSGFEEILGAMVPQRHLEEEAGFKEKFSRLKILVTTAEKPV